MNEQIQKTEKMLNWALGLSVALLGLSSAVMSIAALAGVALPDALTRALGAVCLLSLPVLVYGTVKKAMRREAPPAKSAAANGVKKPKKKKRKK